MTKQTQENRNHGFHGNVMLAVVTGGVMEARCCVGLSRQHNTAFRQQQTRFYDSATAGRRVGTSQTITIILSLSPVAIVMVCHHHHAMIAIAMISHVMSFSLFIFSSSPLRALCGFLKRHGRQPPLFPCDSYQDITLPLSRPSWQPTWPDHYLSVQCGLLQR